MENSSKLKLFWVRSSNYNKKLKFTNELAEELYKPVTRKFQRRRVNVNSIDEILAADLIDMK